MLSRSFLQLAEINQIEKTARMVAKCCYVIIAICRFSVFVSLHIIITY